MPTTLLNTVRLTVSKNVDAARLEHSGSLGDNTVEARHVLQNITVISDVE